MSEGWALLLMEVLFSGGALGFGIWQLVSVRRAIRRDREAAARERGPAVPPAGD